jgi:hypothetical protein
MRAGGEFVTTQRENKKRVELGTVSHNLSAAAITLGTI